MDSRGRQLLQDARRRVAESWCRGADARDAHGFEVDPWDDDAVSWSLLGAMVAVLEEEAQLWGEIPLDDLAAAMYALSGLIATESLAEWNDDPQQTQKAVLAVLDRAALAYVEPELLVQVSSN
jgi:beta-glucanase (GH16 family)